MRKPRNPLPDLEPPHIPPNLHHDTGIVAPHRRPDVGAPVQNHPVGRVVRHRDGPHEDLVWAYVWDGNLEDGGGSLACYSNCGLLLLFGHFGRG